MNMWRTSISCWTVIALLAIFAVGCCGKPEGEILTVEGYVIDWDREICYSPDHYHVYLSIAENPEKLPGRWWAGDKYGVKHAGDIGGGYIIKYTKFDYYIRKDNDTIDIQEGKYYVIRYRVSSTGTNNTIISARKPMKINRRIQAAIAKYNNAEEIPAPRKEFEEILAPRVKTEVGSYYDSRFYGTVWRTNVVPMFQDSVVRRQQIRNVQMQRNAAFRSTLLFR